MKESEEKMQRSRSVSERESPQKLEEQFKESARLEKAIRESLQGLGYGQ